MSTKKMRSIIIICIFSISVFMNSLIYATEFAGSSLKNNDTVQDLLHNLNETGDYSNAKFLKDTTEKNRYIYLPFSTNGYLIYDTDLNTVHEYSINSKNAYIEKYDEIYYTGALGYYKKDENAFVEISTGKRIENRDLFISSVNEANQQMEKRLISNTSRIAKAARKSLISGTVPNYKYNPDGICGSTAAGMMLRWYDNNVNGKYVPTSLQSSDGVALIKHLRNYIDGKKPGSGTGDVYTGIMAYCKAQGVSHSGGYAIVDINYVVGRIDTYKRPFVLGLYNHSKYGNHWVTGYGYNITQNSNFVIVNDGWGSRDISINLINCDYIVW